MKIADLNYLHTANDVAVEGGFFFFDFKPNKAFAYADAAAVAKGSGSYSDAGAGTYTKTTPYFSKSLAGASSTSVSY
jgi:hypothetical protein